MKVLISVPGSTQGYQEIEYRVFNGDEELSRVSARMPAQALADVLQVDHVILLVPDSLGKGRTYEAIMGDAIQLSLEPFQESQVRVQPFVLPSRYSTHVKGDIRDFYQAAILSLARWFENHLGQKDDTLEIMVEASTGLNILQVFVYRAVREIAGVLAFLRNVTLRVYNSDPVGKNTTRADIFLTEEHAPLHAMLTRVHVESDPRLAKSFGDHPHPGTDMGYRDIRDRISSLWSGHEVAAFINSVYHGIPLGIVQWVHMHPKTIFKGLEDLWHYIIEHMYQDDTTGVWYRPVRLGPDVAPYALGALLSGQLKQQWSFFRGDAKQKGATYQEMKTFMERMYRHHPVILNRFLADRSIQPEEISCFEYPSLLDRCLGNKGTCAETSIDYRNFFAHAGFERCAVEVFRDPEGKVRFRYAEGAKETIMKWLR